jgi:hypothetical protein
MVSLEFFIGIILSVALRPWGRLSRKRNENQEYFLGGKGGRCVWLTTLPPSCVDCLKIWEPRPPGTLWACPGLQWDCFTFDSKLSVGIYSNCKEVRRKFRRCYSGVIEDHLGCDVLMISSFRRCSVTSQKTGIYIKSGQCTELKSNL